MYRSDRFDVNFGSGRGCYQHTWSLRAPGKPDIWIRTTLWECRTLPPSRYRGDGFSQHRLGSSCAGTLNIQLNCSLKYPDSSVDGDFPKRIMRYPKRSFPASWSLWRSEQDQREAQRNCQSDLFCVGFGSGGHIWSFRAPGKPGLGTRMTLLECQTFPGGSPSR